MTDVNMQKFFPFLRFKSVVYTSRQPVIDKYYTQYYSFLKNTIHVIIFS